MPTTLPVQDLHFSKTNPRLAGFGVTATTPGVEILKLLWETADVLALVRSMAAHGYFAHEPLLVAVENNRHVVLDGNRRLAALKVLTVEKFARDNHWEIPPVDSRLREELHMVQVVFR
jgi:hypothetical protein